MNVYDGGSNARRRPGAPSGPGDAPEPDGQVGPTDPTAPSTTTEPTDSTDSTDSTASVEQTDLPRPTSPTSPTSAGGPAVPQPTAPDVDHAPASEWPAASDRPVEPTDTRTADIRPTDTRPTDTRTAIRRPVPDTRHEPVGTPPGFREGLPGHARGHSAFPDSRTEPRTDPDPRTGVAALSLRYQIGVALALAVVAIAVCVHIGMVFLHVAPSNTVTKQHGGAVDDWIYPEFEQNWKLFAPNPLQQDIAVQVRARVRSTDGGSRTTGWYDLSAQDGRAIDGNLLPSHTQQNELRRSWDFFVATHDSGNRPIGLRGTLSETYLRRIVVLRLEREDTTARGGVVTSVQVRSRTANVPRRSGARRRCRCSRSTVSCPGGP